MSYRGPNTRQGRYKKKKKRYLDSRYNPCKVILSQPSCLLKTTLVQHLGWDSLNHGSCSWSGSGIPKGWASGFPLPILGWALLPEPSFSSGQILTKGKEELDWVLLKE